MQEAGAPLLISHTPMSEGEKASSGCEMGSRWRVSMGFRLGLAVVGTGGEVVPNRRPKPSRKGVVFGQRRVAHALCVAHVLLRR